MLSRVNSLGFRNFGVFQCTFADERVSVSHCGLARQIRLKYRNQTADRLLEKNDKRHRNTRNGRQSSEGVEQDVDLTQQVTQVEGVTRPQSQLRD